MSTLLRLLLVEDNPDDAELLIHELRRGGYELELERVETSKAMRNALLEKTWDLIISDYRLPHFNAPEALEVLKASSLDLPFIIVSGTIGEEAAVTALKAAAHDFLIKSNYARLTHVINRELSEAETRRERRRTEEALASSEKRYRSLFEDLPLAIWEEDFSLVKQRIDALREQGVQDFRSYFVSHIEDVMECASQVRITDVNKAALQMYEAKTREEMLGNLRQVITPDTISSFQEELITIAEGSAAFHWEGTDRTLTGKPIEISLNWSAAPGHEQNYSKVIVSTMDITERKRMEEIVSQYAAELEQKVKARTAELDHTNVELEHANHIKDEFLANMSHELRTPLNSILGLSEALLEQRRGSLNEDQKRSLQTIAASGSHLLTLINDILDLSKIEAGKFDYYPQAVNLNEVCKASLSFVRDQAGKKSINVAFHNTTTIPNVIADPRRLKQILVNLLTNAVKFTPNHGQVTLEVRADLEKELIQIIVIDSGIGIAAEDLKRLFTPFVQLDSKLNRQFEGTGLGLALAQKLTDLHGGSLEVESEVGKGSRFTVNLMYKLAPDGQDDVVAIEKPVLVNQQIAGTDFPSNRSQVKHKILLAEDNEANILTVGEYLESHGYEILVAHDGLEAIEKAQNHNPAVILMDIQMPNMNGLEAMKHLRADEHFASTPIIALTALAMVGDRERCLEAGATEYLSKPVSLKGLREMIEGFLT